MPLAFVGLLLGMTSGTEPSKAPFDVIAYFHGGADRLQGRNLEGLTHIIYSFLRMNGPHLSAGSEHDSSALAGVIALKKEYPALKVLVSVGGWGGCRECSEVFSTDTGRSQFAVSAQKLIGEFGADGIDLDWEYPAIEGFPGYTYSPDDSRNFTLLVRELRSVLGDSMEVSFAAGGFPNYLENSVEWDLVMPLVDRVNVMTYDLVNGFSTRTGHQTPLYSCPDQVESADYAVKYLDSVGVARNKIVIGSAFYARAWENVKDENHGLFQAGKFKAFVPFDRLDGYLSGHGDFERFWDSTAQAPYAYDARDGLFATYDDPRSVALKTKYAMDNGLGGIMFWELSGDLDADGLLQAIVNAAGGPQER